MVRMLQQGAMAATLGLISSGVFVLYDVFTRVHAAQAKDLVVL